MNAKASAPDQQRDAKGCDHDSTDLRGTKLCRPRDARFREDLGREEHRHEPDKDGYVCKRADHGEHVTDTIQAIRARPDAREQADAWSENETRSWRGR